MMKALMFALVASTFAWASLGTEAQAQPRGEPARSAPDRPLTTAERQAAWSLHKAEYRRRLLRDGQASADRWLDSQARTTRGTPPATTATSTRETAGPRGRAGPADKKNCKKVRWVNRATPGFGGNGMTMSRVAVCDD